MWRSIGVSLLVVALLAISSVARAQGQFGHEDGPAVIPPGPPAPPHNLNGVWEFVGHMKGQAPHTTPSLNPPPMTAWAQARYDAAKPGYGPKAAPGGNDPILKCDPTGMPRILFWDSLIEFEQIPGRMLMFFEANHLWRDVWTDGRKLPDDPDITWYGTSIGRWESDDTFVVETVGVNDRQWLDFYGHPHSDEMQLTERYKRLNRNFLSMTVTIHDPKAYTADWVGVPRYYELKPKIEIPPLFCAPSDEEAFDQRIREPAIKKK